MYMNALLIDDEQNNIDNLSFLLEKHCRPVHILGSAKSAEIARTKIEALQPDILFLDIQMPEEDGFSLLKSLPPSQLETLDVIFVTAFDHYGIKAIKFSALDYLLKPIDVNELRNAVQKAQIRLQTKQRNRLLENLLEVVDRNADKKTHRIALPSLHENRLVNIQDIICCESSNNYTHFFLANGEKILVSKPIYEYDALLADYGFLRCHRSHLVNSRHVQALLHEDSGYLRLSNGEKIPISRLKKEEVKNKLGI